MLGYVAAMLLAVLGEQFASGQPLQWRPIEVPYVNNDSSRAYNWCNATVTRMQIDADRIFVVMPRDKPGVPFSLGVVPLEPINVHPKISAFPNLDFNILDDCNAIQNAVDIELTLNDWLWVLDAGLANSPWHHTRSRSCPPKLLKFKSYEDWNDYDGEIMDLPVIENWQPSNVFLGKMQDQNTFAYILDANNAKLSIVNVVNHELELTVHLSNKGDPTSIQNMELLMKDNVHYLYFTYSGSSQLHRIGTHQLRDADFLNKIVTVRTVNHQMSFIGNDNNFIFFNYEDEPGVYKWNFEQFEVEKFIPKRGDIEIGIPTAVAIDSGEQTWVVRRRSTESETGQCFKQLFQFSLQQLISTSDPELWCNMTVTGIQIYGGRAIIALPRNKPGVPFSLGVMPLTEQSSNFKISVFPRWDVQELGNCHTIQNASDIKLTADGWIWVLDAGITNTPQDHTSPPCPPNLFRIKLGNDSEYDVQALNPTEIRYLHPSKLFIDTTREGKHTAYFLDAKNAKLSIFDVDRNQLKSTIHLRLDDDSTSIQNMALVNKNDVDYFYFTYSGSNKLRRIGTQHLLDENFLEKIATMGPVSPEMSFLGSDNNLVFFNYKDKADVSQWNIVKHFPGSIQSIGRLSGIPSAVARDSNGKIWGVGKDSANSCFHQKIGSFSL